MTKKTLTGFVALLCAVATPALAATRIEVPGGWYGENLPGGEYAVLLPGDAIQTHVGRIALPLAETQAGGAGPLYLRITAAGGFAFAGQSHVGLGTWEWRNGTWTLHAVACGVSPVIYDLAGALHLSDCSIGSQGWRYADDDGHLVTGDASFLSTSLRVWEWTEHQGITIGQSGVGGCVAIDGADRRQLEPGDCRFVRFSMAGDILAVTLVKQPEHKTVLLWFTRGELATFPPEPTEATTAPPVPGPTPMPVPVPIPAPSAIPDESATVRLVAAENAGLMARLRAAAATCFSDADPSCATVSVLKGEMTRRIAWAIFQHDRRWGLRRKPAGTHATRPSDGEPHSTDVVMWKDDGKVVDVMSDRDAGWSSNPDDFQPIDQWLQPQPEGPDPGTGPVTPPPPPPPPPVDQSAVLEQLRTLAAGVAALHDQVADEARQLRVEIAELREQVITIGSHPVVLPPMVFPNYSGKVLGQAFTLKPVK